MLIDQDGNVRPFNEFKQLAKKVNDSFNKNYLQAEYQTARTAAQMAEKWERLQETKDLFPNLEFRTVGDDRVRDDHEKLNGIIKPIDDDFWNKYYPPLDWRCRCDVRATAADANDKLPADLPAVKFKGNVGKNQEIFTSKGSFFQLLKTNDRAVRNAELSKLAAPYETIYKNAKTGKALKTSIFYDKRDFNKNYESAIVIVDNLKINVDIRPHVNINGFGNPEYFINGFKSDLKWDFKKNNFKGIENAISSAKKQGAESIVFDFTYRFSELKIDKIVTHTTNKVHFGRAEWLNEIIFIWKNKSVIITRDEILKGKLTERLERLKAD